MSVLPLAPPGQTLSGHDTSKESQDGWERLDGPLWPFRKLTRYRRQNRRTAAILRQQGLDTVADRLELCGRLQGFKECGNGHRKSLWVWRCEKRGLCPICDGKRTQIAARRYGVYAQLLQESKAGKRAGYRWRHLSLPIATRGDIPGAVAGCWAAWAKLWRHRLGGTEKGAPVAAVASMEISPSGNVHLHVGYFGPHVAQDDLSRWWGDYTGGSFVVSISDKGATWERVATEVLKYAAKPADTPVETLVAFWKAIKGKGRVRPYGALRADVLSRLTGLSKEEIDERVQAAEEDAGACPECGDRHTRFVLDASLETYVRALTVGHHARLWTPETGNRPPPKQYQR
jgi:hypothetical protein